MKCGNKNFVTFIFLFIIGLLFLGIPANYIYQKITADPNAENVQNSNIESQFETNWEELYPFDDPSKNIKSDSETYGTLLENNEFVKSYKSGCTNLVSEFERKINGLFVPRDTDVLYLYGKLCKLAGVNMIKDTETTTINVGNGYLYYRSRLGESKGAAAQNVIDFSHWLKDRNTELLFVSVPSKNVDDQYAITNINVPDIATKKELCTMLGENNINVLNINDFMPENYEDYILYFYKTDHHWTAESGLWASGIIAKNINNILEMNADISLLDPSNYKTTVYPKSYLGTQGRKVGLGYTAAEDFSIISPKFDTHFHVLIPKAGIDTDGDFMIQIDQEGLKTENPYEFSGYEAYSYSNQPLEQITNYDAVCNKKILCIKDSMANCVIPYLSLIYEKVDAIDLRTSLGCFSGSLKTYIEQNDYDMVVIISGDPGYGTKTEINNTGSVWYFE